KAGSCTVIFEGEGIEHRHSKQRIEVFECICQVMLAVHDSIEISFFDPF
ncbi:12422_t:CDS:1, partial [Funneliformis mosseae]